jgi:SnoaL-like protein
LTTPWRLAALAVAAFCLVLGWRSWESNDEQAIHRRLDALTVEINRTVNEGFSTVERAADIGSYFTEDAVVDLGEGASPIVGRATLVGMASRLQRRTAAFRLRLDDVGVRMAPGGATAAVTLTASFIQRDDGGGGDSMDAREFALSMAKASGVWRIARVTAVDTLK